MFNPVAYDHVFSKGAKMRFTCLRLRALEKTYRLFLGTAGERGAEIVEFAFVAPLLITLMLGIFWVGRAYNTYQTITRAAREGARYAAAPTCATCGSTTLQPSCGTGMGIPAGQNAFPGQSGGDSGAQAVRNVVDCVLAADSLETTQQLEAAQQLCNEPNPNLLGQTYFNFQQDYTLNPTDPASDQEVGVVVTVRYPACFPIPFVKIDPFILTAQVQMRQEY